MDFLDKHIDVLLQAPLAVVLIFYLYMSNGRIKEMVEGYQKTIEKLLDKIK